MGNYIRMPIDLNPQFLLIIDQPKAYIWGAFVHLFLSSPLLSSHLLPSKQKQLNACSDGLGFSSWRGLFYWSFHAEGWQYNFLPWGQIVVRWVKNSHTWASATSPVMSPVPVVRTPAMSPIPIVSPKTKTSPSPILIKHTVSLKSTSKHTVSLISFCY